MLQPGIVPLSIPVGRELAVRLVRHGAKESCQGSLLTHAICSVQFIIVAYYYYYHYYYVDNIKYSFFYSTDIVIDVL